MAISALVKTWRLATVRARRCGQREWFNPERMNVTVGNQRLAACVWLCAIVSSAGVAFAQAPVKTLADCHQEEDGPRRLACYDEVSGRARPSTPKEAERAPTPAAATAFPMPADPDRAAATGSATPLLDASWNFAPDKRSDPVRYYRANYFLFGRYTNDVNNQPFTPLFEAAGVPPQGLDPTEAKFQVSFKARVWPTESRNWGVWAAYTQQSQWQVYNEDLSRPFRETNYMPELFVSYKPDVALPGGFYWGLFNFGFNHQSNGRSDPLSRSWNRIFADFGVERRDLVLYGRLWYRLPESDSDDDNPDITDYYGYGEIGGVYRWPDTSSLSGFVRGNVGTGKGAVQLAWTSRPLFGSPFRAYLQLFSGYGESLIDYNWRQTTIGAGIALSDGL